jgi:hypothetical protein
VVRWESRSALWSVGGSLDFLLNVKGMSLRILTCFELLFQKSTTAMVWRADDKVAKRKQEAYVCSQGISSLQFCVL